MRSVKNAISPVIGTILIVSIVISLVILVSITTFETTNKQIKSPDASIMLDSYKNNSIRVSVLRNKNIESIYLRKGNSKVNIGSSAGSTEQVQFGDGTYTIIGEMADGSEQVISKKDFSGVEDARTLMGKVRINPPVPNAEVKALDSEGNTIAVTNTDDSGYYYFTKENIDRVIASTNGVKPSELDDPSVINNPLYASMTKKKTDKNLSFDFDINSNSNSKITATINNREVDIVYNKTENGNLQISNIYQLQGVKYHNLDKKFELISDIDATATSEWNNGNGFEPIGSSSPFTGVIDGNYYTIDGLYIDRQNMENVGLISENQGEIKNLNFINADITGDNYVGIVVGDNSARDGVVDNTYASGITRGSNSGNLVGNKSPLILKIDPSIEGNESTTDTEFNINTSGDYNYEVYGNNVTGGSKNCGSQYNCKISLTSNDTTEIKISANKLHIDYDYGSGSRAILALEQWGDIQWVSLKRTFYSAENMEYNATDNPDLTYTNSMNGLFRGVNDFNKSIRSWDTRNIKNMRWLFYSSSFNQDISSWNTSNVTNMESMFNNADKFNQDISSWNTSNVRDMSAMFNSANNFDENLSSWNTSNVEYMGFMFYYNDNFDNEGKPLKWNTSSVENMNNMFRNADAFNRDISSWNTSDVDNMIQMFYDASSFNQDISSWCVSQISSKPSSFDSGAGFDGETSKQPNWGTTDGCS